MHPPRFGMITASQLQPGFAFKYNGKEEPSRIYVVTEITGEPKSIEASEYEQMQYVKEVDGDIVVDTYIQRNPERSVVPYKAVTFEQQTDGFYRKLTESETPIYFTEGDQNPHYSPVKVKRDGDKLSIIG